MDKRPFYFKLIPPRPTFPYDMTKEEKELMDKHGAYFQEKFDAGKLLLYGPVMAPQGDLVWGYSRSWTRQKPGSSGKTIPRCALV
jgi:hypothetical protein